MAMPQASVSPTALSRLESLPPYLLFDICDYLCQNERRNHAISALALASRTCCSFTEKERFRGVHFAIHSPKKLRQEVEEYRGMLERGSRLDLVRTVRITGVKMALIQEEDSHSRPASQCDEDPNMSNDLASGLDQTLGGWWLPLPDTLSDREAHEEAWKPLVELCKDLTSLKDLIFEVHEQIPPSLLATLHDNHPNCRLHVHHFRLRSLIHSEREEMHIDPNDVALATSPCLYSIKTIVHPYDSGGVVDYNEDAVMDMVKGSAPALRSVELSRPSKLATQPRRTAPRPPWQGFPRGDSGPAQPSIGHVQHLVLSDFEGTRKALLLKWSQHTNFGDLRSLEIRGTVKLEAVDQVAQIARETPLKALTTLLLYPRPLLRCGGPEMDAATAQLLGSLYPLRSLTIGGVHAELTFNAVIDHHGKTLRRFVFFQTNDRRGAPKFVISAIHIERLTQRCSDLEYLDLRVSRLLGNEEEISVYRQLSRLPRLNFLRLCLDCPTEMLPLPNNRDFDEEEDDSIVWRSGWAGESGGVTAPILQKAFKNAAIDSKIALSIFQILGDNNNLRTVELLPCGFNVHAPFGRWLRWIGRKWIIQRDPKGGICIQEFDVASRDEAKEEIDGTNSRGNGRERSIYIAAWKGLWPPQSEIWWDDWYSFPLEGDSRSKESEAGGLSECV